MLLVVHTMFMVRHETLRTLKPESSCSEESSKQVLMDEETQYDYWKAQQ